MRKILLWLPVALASALMLGGCHEHKPSVRIGVSQCSDDDWRDKMNQEILREALFHPDAEVEIRSAHDDNGRQKEDMQYFIDNDFDVIIVSPREAEAATPVISEAYKKGIPVLVFDRQVKGDDYTVFVGADNAGIGETASKYAAHLLNGKGKVIEITGLMASTPAVGRRDGFHKGIASFPGMEIVGSGAGNWNDSEAERVADSLLTLYPDANLIYAHNDRMAIAARNVARSKGLNPHVIGIDAAPNIGVKAVTDSLIDATFLYPTEGDLLLRTALAMAKGDTVARHIILPSPSAVDKTNADIMLMQQITMREETEKLVNMRHEVDEYWKAHNLQTSLFYSIIAVVLLLIVMVFVLIRAFWNRKRHQQELLKQNQLLEEQRDVQKRLNEQLQVATQSKLIFFTNVSHDLRTPLTLIAEPVQQILKDSNLTPVQRSLMEIADKNVHILLRLINQILDFRKYENGRLVLNVKEVALGKMLVEWAGSFATIARKRDIKLTVDVDIPAIDSFSMAIDEEKIERVVFNLMSNAFKYTPDNGRIAFKAMLEEDKLVITVSDTGIGLSEEDAANVFERFFQVEKIHPNGSGIGLSLVKAFVELHGGEISVKSTEGEGSEFKVVLPVTHVDKTRDADQAKTDIHDSALAGISGDALKEISPVEMPDTERDDSKPLLLVIDDNADIRRMLEQLMGDEFNIINAVNGRDGVAMAAKYVPDLIVCDVMMPVMDGLECCKLIKGEISTSHIPVLMLTACSMDEQRVQGYESGADGYVSKPFKVEVLKARIESLLANRRRIRELWERQTLQRPVASKQNQADNGDTDIAPTIAGVPTAQKEKAPASAGAKGIAAIAGGQLRDIDSEFYNRFLSIVKEQMGDSDLNVDSLAGKMGLGRSQFYRKIKALTNYSPVELLRKLRLSAARELLTTTDKSVSEVAYEVGFSTPAYFTRCYREAYGETPSDLRDRLGMTP